MDQAVRGDDVRQSFAQVHLAAVEPGDAAASLLDQHHAGGHVPGVGGVLLDEGIEATSRDVRHRHCGTPDAACAACMEVQLLYAQDVLVDHVGIVVLQPGGDERPLQIGGVTHLHRGPAALLGGVHLVAQRVVDHAGDERSAGLPHGDRHTPRRQTARVVRGAVERVDDPGVRPIDVAGGALLPHHRVDRIAAEEHLDDRRLRGLVGPRDDVGARRLLRDLHRAGQPLQELGAAGASGDDGGLEQLRRRHELTVTDRIRPAPNGSAARATDR